jgi:RNA polymerase sigma-70 factor (ECF subfamily)
LDRTHGEFLRLYTSALPALRAFVLAHLPDFHEAEDALQRSAMVLWDKFGDFRPGSDFAAWAFAVARREVLRSRRGAARSRLVLTDDLSGQVGEQLSAGAGEIDARRAHLAHCVDRLPETSRRALDMKYGRGLAAAKIAEALSVTVNAVRLTLYRARRAIAECLRRSAAAAPREDPA